MKSREFMVDVLEQIKEQLADSNPSVRQIAVKKLSQIKHPSVFELLVSAAKDPDPDVRMYAASAIGTTDDVSAVPTLLRLLRDTDPNVRISAIKALRSCKEDMAISRLIVAANDPEVKVRVAVLITLTEYSTPNAEPVYYSGLLDESPLVRAAAAAGLDAFNRSLDWEKIIPAINDVDSNVRYHITNCLSWNSSEQVKSALLNRLQIESEPFVQGALIEALGKLKVSDSISIILPFLEENIEQEIRIQSAHALGLIGSPNLLEGLFPFIEDEDEDFQLAIIESIVKIGNPSAIPMLERLIDTENENDPLQITLQAAIQKLRAEISIPPVPVQFTAVVTENDTQENQDIKNLGSEDPIIRIKTSRMLAQLVPSPINALIRALEDPNPLIRAYAAETLGLIRNSQAIEPLKKIIADSNATVQAFSMWALSQCGVSFPGVSSDKYHQKKRIPPYRPSPKFHRKGSADYRRSHQYSSSNYRKS